MRAKKEEANWLPITTPTTTVLKPSVWLTCSGTTGIAMPMAK